MEWAKRRYRLGSRGHCLLKTTHRREQNRVQHSLLSLQASHTSIMQPSYTFYTAARCILSSFHAGVGVSALPRVNRGPHPRPHPH